MEFNDKSAMMVFGLLNGYGVRAGDVELLASVADGLEFVALHSPSSVGNLASIQGFDELKEGSKLPAGKTSSFHFRCFPPCSRAWLLLLF